MTTDKMTISEYRASQKKKPKYGNKGILVDGIWFQSTKEGKRYEILKLLERVMAIKDLKRQQTFVLAVNGKVICRYRADFTYTLADTGEKIVEDTKGYRTEIYRLKRKMMEVILGIKIKET